LRVEPGHLRQREETHIASSEDKRVGYALEPAELHGEVIKPLGIALFLRPRASASAGDEMPELEVVAREVVGAFSQLKVVSASRKPAHRDLEGAQPSESGEEVRTQTTNLIACGIAARTPVGAPAGLRLDAQVAVTLVESLAKALASDRGGGPDNWCARGHLPAIILRCRCATRPFSRTRDVRK